MIYKRKGDILYNLNWSKKELTRQKLGIFGEYYAKMFLISYGIDLYSTVVDDHGVDFVARDVKTDIFYEIQVKSLRKGNYAFIPEKLMDCNDSKRIVCFLKFVDGRLPDVYVIPATAWQNLNEALIYRKYDKPGQSNRPEWGISCAIKNLPLLEKYRAEKYLEQ